MLLIYLTFAVFYYPLLIKAEVKWTWIGHRKTINSTFQKNFEHPKECKELCIENLNTTCQVGIDWHKDGPSKGDCHFSSDSILEPDNNTDHFKIRDETIKSGEDYEDIIPNVEISGEDNGILRESSDVPSDDQTTDSVDSSDPSNNPGNPTTLPTTAKQPSDKNAGHDTFGGTHYFMCICYSLALLLF